jgi:hypothetical protein
MSLYKRKIIAAKDWWRTRKKLTRDCGKCITNPISCPDTLINIYAENGAFIIIKMGFCCKTLGRRIYYYVEEGNVPV